MNIAFDLDGVLYDWHHAWHTECRIHEENTPEDFEEFWTKYVPQKSDFAVDNYYTKLQHLYSNMPPVKGLLDMMNKISSVHSIYYITSRPEYVRTTTEAYLRRWEYPQRDNLFMTLDKTVDARALAIDLFVEDKVENLEALSQFTKVLGIKQIWNKFAWDNYTFLTLVLDVAEYLGL